MVGVVGGERQKSLIAGWVKVKLKVEEESLCGCLVIIAWLCS